MRPCGSGHESCNECETPASTRFQFGLPSAGTLLSITACYSSQLHHLVGKTSLDIFPNKIQILGLTAHLPRSLDSMPGKPVLPNHHKRVQLLKVDEFTLVPWELSQLKGMSLLNCCKYSRWVHFTFLHCGRKLLSPIYCYTGVFKMIPVEDTTSHTHMCMSCISA